MSTPPQSPAWPTPVIGRTETPGLRRVLMAMRLGAIVVGVGVIAVSDGGPTLGDTIALGLLTFFLVWRLQPSLASRTLPLRFVVTAEAVIALVAVVVSGGWSSPVVLAFGVPLLAVGLALGFVPGFAAAGFGLVVITAAAAILGDPAAPTPVATTVTIALLGPVIGGLMRAAIVQAQEEHDQTLGRIEHLGSVNSLLSALHDLLRTLPAPRSVDEIVGLIRGQLDELFEADVVMLLLAEHGPSGGGERWRPVYAEGVRMMGEIPTDALPPPLQAAPPGQRPVFAESLAPGEGIWTDARSGAYLWLWSRAEPRVCSRSSTVSRARHRSRKPTCSNGSGPPSPSRSTTRSRSSGCTSSVPSRSANGSPRGCTTASPSPWPTSRSSSTARPDATPTTSSSGCCAMRSGRRCPTCETPCAICGRP